MKRPGVTLTEVLVAIFIMGIGMISLLVLFPLGGLKMSIAIKDERTAHCAANAEAIARMFDLANDPAVFPKYTEKNPPANGPSHPVYIDPLGVTLGSNTLGSGIARVFPQKLVKTTEPYEPFRRWMTLLDDINFNEDGVPKLPGGILDRERRYTWAYLCRQVKATTPTGTPPFSAPDGIELTVVVYDRRPEISAIGGQLPNEHACTASFQKGNDQATIAYSGTPPPVRKGTWVLDSTLTPINGYFYRVASVDDNGTNTLTLSLTQPARADGTACVVMEDVVEVFEKGIVK